MAMPEFTLGLDLGSASIGWAIIELDSSQRPKGLLSAGVRIFEPGVEGSNLDIEQGKDKSRAVARREARLHRRQLRRRAARQRELFLLLQSKGLLPFASDTSAELSLQRHEVLNALDRSLTKELCENNGAEAEKIQQVLPYFLRKAGLDRRLTAHELGRVLYHLIQRRGFKSNRREGKKQDEDLGQVKKAISELSLAIAESSARTLGEYFAGLNPHERRIRARWTSRAMYEEEFNKLWNVQAAFWPELLNAEFKADVASLLFFQRPIAAQEHLIGFCELEPKEHRAPWASLEAQRFRVLQKVNDLAVISPGDLTERKLDADQRKLIYELLDHEGDKTFAAIRKALGLKQARFNLERGGETKLRGNRTNALMREVFRVSWPELSPETQAQIVGRWMNTESEDELVNWLASEWALDEAAARRLAEAHPEDGYCGLSLKALHKVMPRLAGGEAYETVRRSLYPDLFKPKDPLDKLPIVRDALPTLRNPAVERALTEVRKVVNAIVRENGKPYEIRIEMARELRKSRKERETAARQNRSREKDRDAVKAKMLKECGIQNPSRADIEKALLFEECGGVCPYTGRAIEFSFLFGDSQFDVEHIIPLSRCPDDSFVNKTLCYHEENRSRKRGRTPWEAYSADEEHFDLIIQRVRSWKPGNEAKLRRFLLRSEEELAEFTQRQMNDTRYTTRLAVDLLSTLYGGRDIPRGDGTNRRTIHATTGIVTATLRKSWGLEAILREAAPAANAERPGKPRTDHRHHAIDAIAIALTSQATVQQMSVAAASAPGWQQDRRVFRRVETPWPNFVDSVRPVIQGMLVSHRPEHKMSGALHKETLYGKPHSRDGLIYVNLRRRVEELSPSQVKEIADPAVRRAVEEKLAELGDDPKKFVPENVDTLPFLVTNRGGHIPIRKVRVCERKNLDALVKLKGSRFVQSDEIHHIELFVRRIGRKEVWEHVPVTLMDAYSRHRQGLPIVERRLNDDPEAEFLFSLMKGDLVEMEVNKRRDVFRVKKFYSAGPIWFAHCNNAQQDKDQQRDSTRWSKRPDALRLLKPRKVAIDALGRIHPAND